MHYLYVAANALDLTSKLYLRYFMNLEPNHVRAASPANFSRNQI